MKTTKRFAALFIAVLLVCSMIPFVSAADDGSITIDNARDGQKYSIYRILKLESFSGDAHSYTLESKWNDFLNYTKDGKNVTDYLAVNPLGYIEWRPADTSHDNPAAKEFANLAFSFAKEKSIDAEAFLECEGTTLTFSNIPLGYYLVSSSIGSVCSLDTTNKTANITDKNALPSIEKYVQEDSTQKWGAENTAQIGQRVNYKTIIKANTGAIGYIVHDTMESGLTFDDASVQVTTKKVGANNESLVAPQDYTLTTTAFTDLCTFEIEFKEAFLKDYEDNDEIIIYYSAMLNGNAEIFSETNDNTVYLEYGDGVKTKEITTQTKTFKFDLVKTDEDDKVLNGATFRLYYMVGSVRQYVGVVLDSDGTYRPALGETPVDIPAGQATVKGMDGDGSTVYYLEEITAPAGYNKLKDPVKVVMTGEGNRVAIVLNGVYDTTNSTGVQVENHKGAELPSTGGFGTKMFYLCGGLLTVVAFTHLVTRKRMKNRA